MRGLFATTGEVPLPPHPSPANSWGSVILGKWSLLAPNSRQLLGKCHTGEVSRLAQH